MDKELFFKFFDVFVEFGGNFIDIVNGYQNEELEIWIGEWMVECQNCDQFIIVIKYIFDYCVYKVGKGNVLNIFGNYKKSLYVSVCDFLCKLQMDYIDIMYVYWWDWMILIFEVMNVFYILVE